MGKLTMATPRLKTVSTALDEPVTYERNDYYNSQDHRAWRALIISRANGTCQWPGCNRREPRMFADHIVEIRDCGSRTDPLNGQCLCGKHHSLKTYSAKMERPFHFPTAYVVSHR